MFILFYLPDTTIFLIKTEEQAIPLGNTLVSLPTSNTSLNKSIKFPETVITSKPLPFLPS